MRGPTHECLLGVRQAVADNRQVDNTGPSNGSDGGFAPMAA